MTARISFDDKVDMLKRVADHENLSYDIEYDAEAFNEDKSLVIMPSNDDKYADIKFKVPLKTSSESIQERKWRYAMKFIFLENNRNIYDTTFISDVRYFIKAK